MNDSWPDFTRELQAALDGFIRGDAGPFKALWSHGEDVSILGALGGSERGWALVGPRLDWAASQYREGCYERRDTIAEFVGADLACTAEIERIRCRTMETGDIIVREVRMTRVFRLEHGGWRVAHQHGDPLVEKRPSY
jgi:hypothetical protein